MRIYQRGLLIHSNAIKAAAPLLLAGAGHSHLVAIREWVSKGFRAPVGSTLITPGAQAWYSGMMPGLIAGRFRAEDCAIDLEPLCRAAGIELVIDEVEALEADGRRLALRSGSVIDYELLSLDVGSNPPAPRMDDDSVALVPAKPFADFSDQWQHWQCHGEPQRLAVLGGGAAAFELALALQRSMPNAHISMISGAPLLRGQAAGAIRSARRLLQVRGVTIIESCHIDSVKDGALHNGSRLIQYADALILATGASALPWQVASGLRCDSQGFVTIGSTLQSLSHPDILASGDCASLPGAQRSGVYAVRQGPTLAHNLAALLTGSDSLRNYRPQKQALALLSTADGRAILSYHGLSWEGRLVGRWKDHLDLRFMQRHRMG